MAKLKLQIIVLFQNLGEEQSYFARSPAPPLSGILLAGLTPDIVEVEVLHEMVRPIDYETDADCIALSFMDYCAPHAYEVAARFRGLGKMLIAGGKYPSTFPELVAPHFDSVVVGEAEPVWAGVVEDLVAGRLRRRYDSPLAPCLRDIPPPRYDLVEPAYSVPVVTEATRGCPFACTYCQLNIKRAPYRKRPIEDVIRDLTATGGLSLPRRKMAMIYDNNFGGDMAYAKDLLREIAQLDLWGVGYQFSFNCLRDDEFVNLLSDAHCAMAFIGMESLNPPSLLAVQKRQNRVEEYQDQFLKLKERGILIPIPGTPFHREVEAEGRIFDYDLSHYEGDHLVFTPRNVSPAEVFGAFESINRDFYSWTAILGRWGRFLRTYLAAGLRRRRAFELGRRLVRSGLLAFIYFKLSVFQRHHAQHKVFGSSSCAPGDVRSASPPGAPATAA